MGRLESAVESAAEGRGATVLLEGPAGSGKSHLLAWAAALAADRGLRVLFSRGMPLGGSASFGLALDLLGELIDPGAGGAVPPALRRLLDDTQAIDDGDEAAAHACFAFGQVCESAAAERPLALLVDDAQWADPASLAALAAVSARTDIAPIALFVAARSGERTAHPEALAVLRGESPAEVLRLRELSEPGVGELLELRGVEHAGHDFVAACMELTAGNPFLVTLVAGLLGESGLPPTPSSLENIAAEGADAVAAAIAPRLQRLGPLAERLTALCSVLAGEADSRRVAALAGVEVDDRFAATVDGLAAAGILAPGEPLLFAHPLVREAIYRSYPAAARGRDHDAAASLLAAEGADAEIVASHLLRAPAAGSEATVELLLGAAGQALRRGVPASAVEYLGRALREPAEGEGRARTLLRIGYAEGLLGNPEAEQRFRDARSISASPQLRAEADLRLGRSLYAGGDLVSAEHAFERGLAELPAAGGDSEDGELASELRASSLAAARYAGSLQRDDPRLLAVRDGDYAGATRAERALLCELAVEAGLRGEPRERVIALARRAWADGEMLRSSDCQAITISQVGAALVWSGAFEEAERILSTTARHAEVTGSKIGGATVRYGRAWVRLYGGDLIGAVEDVEAALATEGWEMYEPAARAALAHIRIGRAELDAAARALDASADGERQGEGLPLAMVLEARGRLAALDGDLAGALDRFEACGELLAPVGEHQPFSQWRLRAALCLHGMGRPAQARSLLDLELSWVRRAGSPRPLGMTLAALGVVVGGQRGLEHLLEANVVLADSSARLAHARAQVDLGAHLRRLGRDREARGPLREALAAAHEMGAALIAERAAAELTAAGGRPRSPALRGPEALTPAERRVATLAARGHSNREIAEELVVSPKTVQFHLTNAYRKLGIDSREKLARALG